MSVNIKATPVNGLFDFVQSDLTKEEFDKVMATIPESERGYWTGRLLAHELVPLEATNRFTEAAAEAKGEQLRAFARRAGRHGAELGLKTVYKFVLLVMSVEGVLKKAPFMWTRVYDGGKIDVQSGTNHASITVSEFTPHRAVCGRITGWFEVIGERTGAKNVRVVHKPCVAEGGEKCVWEFKWDG